MCAEELLIGEQLPTQFEKEKKAVLGGTVQTLSMKPKTGYGQVETGRVEPRFQVAKREGPELLLVLSNQEQQ